MADDPAREPLQAIRLEPPGPVRACVVWLHGLGADGSDFEPIVPELRLPAGHGVRFVFPHAPVRPISINHGMPMRGWYDVRDPDLEQRQDEAGVEESAAHISALLDAEAGAGVDPGSMVLAGFSQGGAIALHCALRYPRALAGVLALSTYLPVADRLGAERSEANAALPVFMGHGTWDPIIPKASGQRSFEQLQRMGYPAEWHEYPMQHAVCAEEVADIATWLAGRLAR